VFICRCEGCEYNAANPLFLYFVIASHLRGGNPLMRSGLQTQSKIIPTPPLCHSRTSKKFLKEMIFAKNAGIHQHEVFCKNKIIEQNLANIFFAVTTPLFHHFHVPHLSCTRIPPMSFLPLPLSFQRRRE
jgi:hypothetical protein